MFNNAIFGHIMRVLLVLGSFQMLNSNGFALLGGLEVFEYFCPAFSDGVGHGNRPLQAALVFLLFLHSCPAWWCDAQVYVEQIWSTLNPG